VYALGAALFFSGVGSLLTVFGVKAGYFFLVLFLVPVTVMMHPFWDAQGDAAQEQMKSFLLNTSLTGALLALLGSSCSAPASKGAAPSKVTKGKKKN
jgi:putative oxidoreductase